MMQKDAIGYASHRVIFDFVLGQKSGTLTFQPHGRKLYFEQGNLIFANSERLDEHFAEILVEMGILTAEQLEQARQNLGPNESLGKYLRAQNLADPKSLALSLKQQITKIIEAVLRERDLEIEVQEDVVPARLPKLKIHTLALLFQSITHIQAADFFSDLPLDDDLTTAEDFQSRQTQLSFPEPYDRFVAYVGEQLRTNIEELSREFGWDRQLTRRVVYVLYQMDMVSFQPPPSAEVDAALQATPAAGIAAAATTAALVDEPHLGDEEPAVEIEDTLIEGAPPAQAAEPFGLDTEPGSDLGVDTNPGLSQAEAGLDTNPGLSTLDLGTDTQPSLQADDFQVDSEHEELDETLSANQQQGADDAFLMGMYADNTDDESLSDQPALIVDDTSDEASFEDLNDELAADPDEVSFEDLNDELVTDDDALGEDTEASFEELNSLAEDDEDDELLFETDNDIGDVDSVDLDAPTSFAFDAPQEAAKEEPVFDLDEPDEAQNLNQNLDQNQEHAFDVDAQADTQPAFARMTEPDTEVDFGETQPNHRAVTDEDMVAYAAQQTSTMPEPTPFDDPAPAPTGATTVIMPDDEDEEDERSPQKRGPNKLLTAALVLVLIAAAAFYYMNNTGSSLGLQTAQNTTQTQAPTTPSPTTPADTAANDEVDTPTDATATDQPVETAEVAEPSDQDTEGSSAADTEQAARSEIPRENRSPSPTSDSAASKAASETASTSPASNPAATNTAANRPAPAPAVEPLSVDDINLLTEDTLANFRGQDNNFSLVYMVACQPSSVTGELLRLSDETLLVFPRNLSGRDCYLISWGLFPSLNDANAARSDMPPTAQDAGTPWVVNLDRYR